MYDERKLTELIRTRLDETRFQHSLHVADMAELLARHYGADAEQARAAGILHDATKQAPPEAHRALLKKAGEQFTPLQEQSPNLWHAVTGAIFAKEVAGVKDAEILHAIRYHTTGRANMSILERIIYVADLVSIDRMYPDAVYLRGIVKDDLDAVVFEGAKFCIRRLADKHALIDPATLETYNFYRKG